METIDIEEMKQITRQYLMSKKKQIPSDLHESSLFKDDLGLDSLDMSELLSWIEQRYKIEVDDKQWKNLINLETVFDYLRVKGAA